MQTESKTTSRCGRERWCSTKMMKMIENKHKLTSQWATTSTFTRLRFENIFCCKRREGKSAILNQQGADDDDQWCCHKCEARLDSLIKTREAELDFTELRNGLVCITTFLQVIDTYKEGTNALWHCCEDTLCLHLHFCATQVNLLSIHSVIFCIVVKSSVQVGQHT